VDVGGCAHPKRGSRVCTKMRCSLGDFGSRIVRGSVQSFAHLSAAHVAQVQEPCQELGGFTACWGGDCAPRV
jgi:hypothetical protein